MNLYLVSQDAIDGYDVYDSFVCVAPDEASARHMHPDNGTIWDPEKNQWGSFDWGSWVKPEYVTVELIGTSNQSEAKVICASFNAG